jgi:hypothetical protein
VASLGRAQDQAGDADAAAVTLSRAVEKAEATGDLRLVALARVHLGRVLRGLGRPVEARAALDAASAWHRESGGGEQAALGEVLRAAMDARDGIEDAEGRLTELLHAAEGRGDAPAEVFALDALARLAAASGDEALAGERQAAADRRMAEASHFIAEQDRVDAVRHPA